MTDAELRSQLHEYIAERVAVGFDDLDDIVEGALDGFGQEADEELVARLAEQLAREEMDRHAVAAAAWPAVTDCDRLDAAFDELDAAGIVARQYFTCCNSCGLAEIGGEVPEEDRDKVRGFAFYHRQDAGHAALHGKLYLSYGAFYDEGETAADPAVMATVGEQVAAALRQQGLAVHWDGDIGTRVLVPLTWQRRHTPA